jgi:PadR family transcriptional regulator PadR
MKIEKSLLSGSTPMLILSLLKDGDKYGYEMVETLAKRSDDTFALKEGTLYPILHALEEEGCLESYWEEFENRKRKYYHLTRKGEKRLKASTEEFAAYTTAVKRVLEFSV